MPKPPISKIFDTTSNLWNFYLPILFIGIGILIRSWTYLQNQCLWQDEAVWAGIILNWSAKNILIDKITIPLGLTAVIKILVQSFGAYEYVWRLIPFLCSIGALLLYDYFLRLVASPFVRCLALALLAVLNLPVYSASELRAYSIDLFGLLLLFRAINIVRENPSSRSRAIILLLTGLLLPWFSYAPLFVLPAIMCVFLQDLLRSHKKFSPTMCGSAIFVWGINLICLYFLFYKSMDNSKIYKGQLQDGFPPHSFSWQNLLWFFERSKDFLNVTGFEWPLLSLMFAACGFYYLLKGTYPYSNGDTNVSHRQFLFKLSCGVVFWVLLAAAFHKYPLMPRLQLFLVPLFLWFMAEGINMLLIHKSRWIKICAILLAALTLVNCASRTWHHQLWKKPDMKSALKILDIKQRPGDRILFVEASQYAYEFYYRYFSDHRYLEEWAGFGYVVKDHNKKNCIDIRIGNSRGRLYETGAIQWIVNTKEDQKNLKTILPSGRMWVLFSDSGDERFLLNQLNQYGKKIEQWNDHRIDLYLYEFPKTKNP